MTVVATVLAAALWKGSRGVEHPLMRLNVNLEFEAALDDDLIPMAISTDGSWLTFTTERRKEGISLAVYALDQPKPVLLPGAEGASVPFFSPHGQWAGFFAGIF